MIQNYKENIKNDNDLDCFTFFYKNFNLDCISKISIKEFNKIKNPPFDFKKLLSLYDLSKECLQELWKYTVYVYFASKNVGNMNLLTNPNVPLQIIKSTDYLDTRNEPLTILGDNLSIQKFDNDILKEGDQTSIPFRNFKITEESKYSSLLPKHVKQVEQIFLTWFNHNDIKKIVDATAHIGVDSVHFRLMFPKAEINSYEINTNTYQLLEKNVKDFTIHTHNINFLKADLPSDISFVYIDAPWGGRNYNKIKDDTFELYLGKLNIKEIAKHLLLSKKTKNVILKVPRNYKFSNLSKNFNIKKENVMDKGKISYVLLNLTISNKISLQPYIKELVISSFITIFESLKAYNNNFILNEKAILFAFNLLYLGEEKIIINKDLNNNDYYELLLPFLNKDDQQIVIMNATRLSSILSQYINKIVNSIEYINHNDIISRILLFSTFKNISYRQKDEDEIIATEILGGDLPENDLKSLFDFNNIEENEDEDEENEKEDEEGYDEGDYDNSENEDEE